MDSTIKVIITALVALIFVLGISFCTVTNPGIRPERIILIEEITPSVDANGQCLVYRYFVDGSESFAVLRNEQEVAAFRKYLEKVGRVLEKSDL